MKGKAGLLRDVLSDPARRFAFMVERHQQTLADFDRQKKLLDARIADAEKDGLIADLKHFMGERRKVIGDSAEYDLKMSKELAVWKEFADKSGANQTPIRFVVSTIVPKIVPALPIPD